MSKQTVSFIVTYNLSGEVVDPQALRDVLEGTLEHCRTEGMLSEPTWEETSIDSVTVLTNTNLEVVDG